MWLVCRLVEGEFLRFPPDIIKVEMCGLNHRINLLPPLHSIAEADPETKEVALSKVLVCICTTKRAPSWFCYSKADKALGQM